MKRVLGQPGKGKGGPGACPLSRDRSDVGKGGKTVVLNLYYLSESRGGGCLLNGKNEKVW